MRAKHYYTLLNTQQQPVQIDLANYKTRCTITGAPKQFHHKYLAQLIERAYGNNIDTFRTTYISRAGRPQKTAVERLDDQITRARARLNLLLERQTHMHAQTVAE